MTGKLFLLIGPSGVGKSTVQDILLASGDLDTATGYFTRPMRPGESKRDSFTLPFQEFEELHRAGKLTAVNQVHGHWYGTPIAALREPLDRGRDVVRIFTLDGAIACRRDLPDVEVTTIFLHAPLEVLDARIRARGDDDKTRERRLATAREEIPRRFECDYIVDAFESAETVAIRVNLVIRATGLGYTNGHWTLGFIGIEKPEQVAA